MRLGGQIALGVSLAASVVALYLLVPEPVPVVDTLSAAPAVAASPPAVAREGHDVHAYLQLLLARALSLEETKPLVLAWLTTESARANDQRTDSEYWRSDYLAAGIESLGRRVAAADRIRALLLELYGPSARRAAVFESLFAPLDARYAFLASEQQLALQKLQLERQRMQAKIAPTASAPVVPGAAQPSAARALPTAEAWQQLRAGLGPDAALQYLYRFSPLAEQLRSANLDLSGAEFRDVFATLLNFETAATDPQTFTRTREALRNTLGGARFTRLWAARDPLFGVIAAAGRQQGLAEGAISAAYAVFNDTQDRFADAADRFASVDPQRAAAELHEVQHDMQQRLASLVGADAAEALVRASTHFSVSMQQPSSTNLRE